jgi:hypothetical protein
LQALAHTQAQERTAELAAVLGNEGIVQASFTVRGPVDSATPRDAREQFNDESGAALDPAGGVAVIPEPIRPFGALTADAPAPSELAMTPAISTAPALLTAPAMSTDAVSSAQPIDIKTSASAARPSPFVLAKAAARDDAEIGEHAESAMPHAARVPTDPAESAEAPREPVRLHAEWAAQGVSLWLALDAPVLDQAPLMLAQLQRWLALQGIALLHASCNGKPFAQSELLAQSGPKEKQSHDGASPSHDSTQEHA